MFNCYELMMTDNVASKFAELLQESVMLMIRR